MAETYDVVIKLIGNQKPCNIGHEVGQEWVWKSKVPEGMCFFAYNTVHQFAQVFRYGGSFPWQNDPDVITASCPDAEVVNVFEIRRTPEKGKLAETYDISIKLVGKEVDNPCSAGHNVGDEWQLGYCTPENMCPSAYRAIIDSATVLRYGGNFPWQSDPDVMTITCPDPNVRNRFEIKRIARK